LLDRTFQLVSGVGPWREKDLWAQGIRTWSDFPAGSGPVAVSRKVDDELRGRIEQAREAVAEGDLATLAEMIPAREHWRLYSRFASEAVFFDIEAEGRTSSPKPTVVGLFDSSGVRTFIDGQN
jgi:hypothetical protein